MCKNGTTNENNEWKPNHNEKAAKIDKNTIKIRKKKDRKNRRNKKQKKTGEKKTK